ncbi:MAG: bactofilin family protein [Desulfobacterales bacterium]
MKKRNGKETSPDSITTFLGNGARIEGLLNFEGTVRLDGKVDGQVDGRNGTLIVGENALIKADITVGKAIIMGEIQGAVSAAEKIELHPPGKITGDIQAPIITIEAGAVLNGQCIMKREAPTPQKSKISSPSPTAPKPDVSTQG